MTLFEWCHMAEARLGAVGIEACRLEAQILASHVLNVGRSWVLAHPDHDFNDLAGEVLLQRREAGEPLAYLVGRREFYGRSFAVGPGVLIPRAETETLVEAALSLPLPDRAKVLDVGTGSGCVGITLKLERPDWEATLLDVSSAALRIARENSEALGAEVRFVLADLLPPGEEVFDAIITNPPYVGTGDVLPREVADFEPPLALFAGPDGLDVYRRLAREAARSLRPDGSLLTEVGDGQADAVTDAFSEAGWGATGDWRDLGGTRRVLAFAPPKAPPMP